MKINELNILKEQIVKVNNFNKICLEHEYEKRNDYIDVNNAKDEYITEINMCIERYILKIEEYLFFTFLLITE